ncbi:MAG: pyrroline-5-carboxylate reductase [Rhodospirillaceae bacterium]|nr:MAG: pyrroline-5-carboxylate reductase [Rhodospirillaceae bacterium]
MQGTILLVGSGKMGGALLDGWFKRGVNPVDVMVVEPAGRVAVAPCSAHPALTTVPTIEDVPKDFRPDVIVFAIKPQIVDQALPAYRRFVADRPVFLSVIAGKTTDGIRSRLGPAADVVRAMPNTPAAVGKAMTVLYAPPTVSELQRKICNTLMSAVGAVAWITDEAHMDAVTAVSGSGPAYVFLFAEALTAAGVEAGLAPDLAARLAHATIAGAGAMLEQMPDSPETLRRNVTSPGGTTAAALEVLMGENGLMRLFSRAVAAAAARSRELAG